MIHFLVGVVFSVVLSLALYAYTDFRGFWFWFLLLQAVSLIQMAWGGLYGWIIWKIGRKKAIAKYVQDFTSAGFPPVDLEEPLFAMNYLQELAASPTHPAKVKELAHQIVVMVRTLNDMKKTTERERFLEAVTEALFLISGGASSGARL